jgi:hypothetical protein
LYMRVAFRRFSRACDILASSISNNKESCAHKGARCVHMNSCNNRWIRRFSQCCQGAENLAAKHEKSRKKFGGGGRLWGRIFPRFIPKGPKSGRTFFYKFFLIRTPRFLENNDIYLIVKGIFTYNFAS